ncbi:MAG: hypothetical protein MZV63_46480 [Marinilabiliales bacterium]|nr:hypothetical protein [Marinilabiliales bacterium]
MWLISQEKQISLARVRVFRWNPEKGVVDPAVFNGIGTIISLAGENIGNGRWTGKRKEAILKQPYRRHQADAQAIIENSIDIKTFINCIRHRVLRIC